MCRAVKCRTCAKTTWAGCGQHVGKVMRGVPRADQCQGHAKTTATIPGFLARLFKK